MGVAGSAVANGAGMAVGAAVAVAAGMAVGTAVAVGCGERGGVGSGVVVGVGETVGSGVAVGSGMAVGSGVAVSCRVAVGAGVGVAVGTGPTRMPTAPPIPASLFWLSRMTPAKEYRPGAVGAITVYVTRSTPGRLKVTVWPSTSAATPV